MLLNCCILDTLSPVAWARIDYFFLAIWLLLLYICFMFVILAYRGEPGNQPGRVSVQPGDLI